jgi:hypothetical protein
MEQSSWTPEARVISGTRNGRPFAVMAPDRLAARFVAADALLSGQWHPDALATPEGDILLEGVAFREFAHALLFGWGFVWVDGRWTAFRQTSPSAPRRLT